MLPDRFLDAADLLGQGDPGPTPWLVEGLIVDQAIVAAVGKWKTMKSYALLDIAISIATGRPAFGHLAIPNPGPVVFINEESGKAALWRRLDALCRGRTIDPEELRGRLIVAPNAGVKLDDARWQNDLLDLGAVVEPRLWILDPLARMKAAGRDENSQGDMAELIEFVRLLRDQTHAGVAFIHHQGHAGANMRGSSDLESFWETRLTWTRDGQSPIVKIESEHREAEAGQPVEFRAEWHTETRTIRLELVDEPGIPTREERIIDWLREHHNQHTDEIAKGPQIRRTWLVRDLEQLEASGRATSGPSGRRDKAGRAIRDKVWNLALRPELWLIPASGTSQDGPDSEQRGSVARPLSIREGRPDEPPDRPG